METPVATAVTAAPPAPVAIPAPTPLARLWYLFDLVVDLRSILHMYGDPRYRLTWMGRLIPPALLVLIFTSWFWLPGTSLLPDFLARLLVKVVDLVLAFFLYKSLTREAQRYRDTIPKQSPRPYPYS